MMYESWVDEKMPGFGDVDAFSFGISMEGGTVDIESYSCPFFAPMSLTDVGAVFCF